ncbi:hypothetical protein [Micromonospora okii]|uniref:hypothetical protein n=1 Tax=Micromonospora okii TaxID=1182970 RepID=UPI001E2A4F52|nr:hypothetical protein [Micromonospora okii]
MRRTLALLGLPLLAVAVGCAPAETGPTGTPTPSKRWEGFDQRAAEVAGAWRPGKTWTDGYVPMQEPTVLLGDPGFNPETQQAFDNGWYREQIDIPAARPANGTVQFSDGTLSVPLIGAAEAYRQLDRGDPPPCGGRPSAPDAKPKPGSTAGTGPIVEPGPDGPTPGQGPYGRGGRPGPGATVSNGPGATACIPLTVTAVKLGTAPVRTSRGEAQVPAWLFTVAELTSPVARVAVGKPTAPPKGTPPGSPVPEGVVGAQDLEAVYGAMLTWRLGVGACDTGITPLVWEGDDVVVVGGGVTRSTGVCTEQLVVAPVTATLKEPLGDRTVLDVTTGTPLTLRP